jgi:hypothetical protein
MAFKQGVEPQTCGFEACRHLCAVLQAKLRGCELFAQEARTRGCSREADDNTQGIDKLSNAELSHAWPDLQAWRHDGQSEDGDPLFSKDQLSSEFIEVGAVTDQDKDV